MIFSEIKQLRQLIMNLLILQENVKESFLQRGVTSDGEELQNLTRANV